jgi:hypothetical protein
MAALSDFYPHILPLVRGCDTDTVDFHVRQSAIEFCRRSQAWREELPITVVPNTDTYVLPIPTDAVLSMLQDFDVLDADGNSVDQYHVVNTNRGRKLTRDNRWTAYVYLSDDGLSITVQPVPDSTDSQLVPYVSLKPTQAAVTLPDLLRDQYAATIAAGALAGLLSMPKTAWHDVGLAAATLMQFLSDCGAASVRASRGNARSKTRSRGCFY